MKNLGQMMKQAQQMQQKMAEMQERLAEAEIEGQAGGGLVKVTMTGKGDVKAVRIDPSLASPNEIEVLEDLVLAAVNDARSKVEHAAGEQMKEITGGLELPGGLKLPF
ncbi:YbaB/EbfC family nucleoid-associated protein [Algihabitans albus]|uniref:YbaB/EbfC family nucleoid-associated protein n=1 Tax=Algihabitans albus TaxID=2164067 RepID=UPI0035CF953F